MKKYFIECLQHYKKHGLIDETYKIISEGFIVYEKLSIQFFKV